MDLEKYQVFISSPFRGLEKQRKAIIQAVTNYKHIPIALEIFSPQGQQDFDVIKIAVEECQIYILILGHRYGSIIDDSDTLKKRDISYTQFEFEEAINKRLIPLVFLKDYRVACSEIESDKDILEKQTEMDKLNGFHNLIKRKNIFYAPWDEKTNLEELCGRALKEVIDSKKVRLPGWIRPEKDQNILMGCQINCELNQKIGEYEKDKRNRESRVFRNFMKAQNTILEHLEKSLKGSVETSVCIIGASLRFSWPVVQNVTQDYYKNTKLINKINIKLALVDEGWTKESGIELKHTRSMDRDEEIREYKKNHQSLINDGMLNLSVYCYRLLPQIHGICIDNEVLFLSDSYWEKDSTIKDISSPPVLVVGENEYILYLINDKSNGAGKIYQFNHYFDFIEKTGRPLIY